MQEQKEKAEKEKMPDSFLERNGLPRLAYHKTDAPVSARLVVMFLGGFRSDMQGTKAVFVEEFCKKHALSSLRFDYRGHGTSDGRFEDGCIGDWKADALTVFDTLTDDRPVLLVGSSMGGWIGLLLAMERAARVCGFIGLAAAPDFTRDIPREMTDAHKAQMAHDGYFDLFNDYGPAYAITQKLLDDGENHCLLDAPIPVSCPVRLIQGIKDTDVPYHKAEDIAARLETADKKIYFRPEGDHRLSTPEDLTLLGELILELAQD